MRISELADRTGIRASAIRYYEKIGLLPSPPRVNGWRRFSPEALDYLTFIGFGIRTGFTLRELRSLLDGNSTREVRRRLAQGKLRQLRHRQERLALQEKILAAAKLCRCGTVSACVRRLQRTGILKPWAGGQ
jgi:DNA-binding transcriptional MerR regulator